MYSATTESGFSIVEVMVASGILAVIALAFATLMNDQQRALRFITAKSEIETVDWRIKKVEKATASFLHPKL